MSWRHVEDREVRGRKEYKCGLCGLRIRKRAKHIVRYGYDEDGHVAFRMHAVCENASRAWHPQDWEEHRDTADFCEFELGIERR